MRPRLMMMEDSNWMTVKEMARFHSLVTLWKIWKTGTPTTAGRPLYTGGGGDPGNPQTKTPNSKGLIQMENRKLVE